MREGGISIWFFIGISLLLNGVLITSAGIWEVFSPPANQVVLFNLHAGVWWGALLFTIGLVYCVRFAPHRQG
jgi:hypothetical protein